MSSIASLIPQDTHYYSLMPDLMLIIKFLVAAIITTIALWSPVVERSHLTGRRH